MTRHEMFERVTPDTMIKSLLREDQIKIVERDVEAFLKEDHKLPSAVLNVILFLAIITTKEKLFNVVYLRKVTETFKKEGAITVAVALKKIEKDFENSKQRARNEPDWMNDRYMKKLTDMGENKGEKNEKRIICR